MTDQTPPGYRALTEKTVPAYLDGLAAIRQRLGGTPADWRVAEVGDGNLNMVFLVDGPEGAVCVKQSLPYVRSFGEAWRMPLERAYFENCYWSAVGPHVPGLAPALYHYEPSLFCIVMEKLAPHIILRRGLIAGTRYPLIAKHVGDYVARACFHTSDLGQPFDDKLDDMAIFAKNHPLIRITVELVFADPYRVMERNRWTGPQLDATAAELRADSALKAAASRMGHRFLTAPQALIHGDLHSGSVMVTESDSRVIDSEFAFYGPIGFDTGAFIANLLLSYFAQPGHATKENDRIAYRAWILEQIPIFWNTFRDGFLTLWRTQAKGDAYPTNLFTSAADEAALEKEREAFIDSVFADTIGFAGCKMIRRLFGFAHVADFDSIKDADMRAGCEKNALALARMMLVEPHRFKKIDDLLKAARDQNTDS
ncbi:MAG TPA: S-methyl-5-thioribose kinase [Magnetospirillaceae bacterium]